MSFPDLILDPLSTPGVLSAKLWIRRGSSVDPAGQRGAHQLLGSLLSRGCGPYGPMELADLVEGCGAGLRCDTHEDALLISLKCRDSDAEQLLPVIGWMLNQPHLRQDQVELEKDLSLQALQRQREDPFHLAYDGWRSLAYGNGGYGHDPLGFADDLKALQTNDLQELATTLKSEGTVLALSGTIPDHVIKRLEKHDSFRSNGDATGAMASSAALSTDVTETLSLREQSTEQVVIMLGQPSLAHGHPDDPALRLLQAHLGQGMSSLLFRRLREEHGVAYDVGVHHPGRAAASPFVFHAATSSDRAALTLELLMQTWTEMATQPISDSDLALARTKVRGQLAHASQTTGQRAERRAQLRGLGLPDNYDQHCLAVMEDLDPTRVQKVASRYLNRPILSLCGPSSTLKTLSTQWMAR